MKRTVIIAILAVFLPAGIYAQTSTPLPSTPVPINPLEDYFIDFGPATQTSDIQEGVDYVTVGSLMPYRVKPPIDDDDMPTGAKTNFSIDYKWLFTPLSPITPTTPLQVLRMPNGTTIPVSNPGAAPAAMPATPTNANWYTTNEVSVRMPNQTGNISLTHSTRYMFNDEILCDDPSATDLTYTIRVVPRPSIKVNSADGIGVGDLEIVSCIDDPVIFPTNTDAGALLIVDGYDKINVQFTLNHKTLGGGTPTPVMTEQWIELDGKELKFPGAMFNKVGIYTIDILNVTDRISRKSLDQDAVKSVLTGADADVPPAGALKVYIYPKPNTPGTTIDVQHIKNVR